VTTHPALPGLLLAAAQEPWLEWYALTRLALADLLDEVGRPAPWLRRGLHPKALARALVRERRRPDTPASWAVGGGRANAPPQHEAAFCCVRPRASYVNVWVPTGDDHSGHRSCARHCLHLVRRHLAGGDTPPGVAACVERQRRRFRRRALCLFPGVLVTAPCPGGSVTCPARDLLPREPGRRRRGHAALDRAISEAVLPPGPGAPRARRAYPARQAFEMIREARRRRGTP
jgi:hypothetical protein